MNKIKIGIVGFGATGLSLFLQLIDDIIKLKLIDLVVINIFEKSDNIGCGLAYIMDFDCNILNRTSSRMSIRHEKPSDFYTWIKNNLHNVVKKYPGIDFLDINSYLPRSVFGLYLQDSYLNGLDLAKRNGVEVKIIQEEVVDVFINNNKFSIQTPFSIFDDISYVALTIGHSPCKKFIKLKMMKSFFNSPYPTDKITSVVENNSDVGILGSRLSAIDSVISLVENGHRGKIFLISRSKYLPSIKSTDLPQCIRSINSLLESRIKNEKSISIKYVIKLMEEFVSCYSGEKACFLKWLNRPLDPVEYIRYELIEYSKKMRTIWDALFSEGNNLIELIWNKLPAKEKLWFLERFKSKWISYRVGIPKQNAIKILKFIESGQVSIVGTKRSPVYDDTEKLFVVEESGQGSLIKVKFLVNATGSPVNVDDMQSTLINNMIQRGLVRKHEHGGIYVDFSSATVIDNNGNHVNKLYAIGVITSGVYFFTSVLALNIKHSFMVSNQIISDILIAKKNCKFIKVDYI